MYEPGKVLKCGGRTDPSGGEYLSATIDLDLLNQDPPQTPQWNFTIPGNLSLPRLNHHAVILADGSVLIVGGQVPPYTNTPDDILRALYHAELWRPWDTTPPYWRQMATMVKPRIHHSIALLLADAMVISMSGDAEPDGPSGNTAEIYSPPYLFAPDGTPAPRPEIGFAPTSVHYGDTFTITLAKDTPVPASQISRVTLVRLGSGTHGFDMDQRFVLLANPPAYSGDVLTVVAPANGSIAPPGNYMLFIISDTGVPSVAWDIWVGPDSVPW